jgi:O-antigen ligase
MTTPTARWGAGLGVARERLAFGHGAYAPVLSRDAARETAATLAHEPGLVRFSRLETWDWGWGGLLIFSILLFFRPQDQLKALGAAHISDMAALIGLGAMAVLNLSRREAITRMPAELIGVLGLGAVIVGTVPFSFWPGGSLKVFTDYYMQVALIFLLMVNTITSPRRVERIAWVIVLAFGYTSGLVIFDYLRGVNLVEGNRAAGPVGGFFENPNDLALNLASFLPLAMMYVKRPGPVAKRLLCAAVCVMMLVAIVFTKSRGGMLGTVAMLVAFLLFTRSLTPAMMIALVVGGILIVPALPSSFWNRMSSITDASKDPTGSREERRLLMEQAWNMYLENPIIGIGAGQFQNYGPPGKAKRWRVTHNAYLQVAAELGTVGLIPFLFVIWRGFKAAWWTRRELSWIYRLRPRKKGRLEADPEDGLDEHERSFLQTHAAAMVAGMIGWAVCAVFAAVAFNWTLYYLLGLAITPMYIVRARKAGYARAKALAQRQTAVA